LHHARQEKELIVPATCCMTTVLPSLEVSPFWLLWLLQPHALEVGPPKRGSPGSDSGRSRFAELQSTVKDTNQRLDAVQSLATDVA